MMSLISQAKDRGRLAAIGTALMLGLLLVCLLGLTVLAQHDPEGSLLGWDDFVAPWVYQVDTGTNYVFEISFGNKDDNSDIYNVDGFAMYFYTYMLQESPFGEIRTRISHGWLTLYPSQGIASYLMGSTSSSDYPSFAGTYFFERIHPDESESDQLRLRIFSGNQYLVLSSENTITEYILTRSKHEE